MQTLWKGRYSPQYKRGKLLSRRNLLQKDLAPPRRDKSEQIQTADKTFERRDVYEEPVTPWQFLGRSGERDESNICQKRRNDIEAQKPYPAISVRELPPVPVVSQRVKANECGEEGVAPIPKRQLSSNSGYPVLLP